MELGGSTMHRWWIGTLIAGVLCAASASAQPAAGDDAQVLAADQVLAAAMRNGDKGIARRFLALQFTFVDETGKIHLRKDFLGDLKAMVAAPSADAKVKNYGLLATVTGHRKSAQNSDVFFLDIWAKQKGAWRAMVMQDVLLAADGAPPPAPKADAKSADAKSADAKPADAKPYECVNPCQTIPYRPRSPVEQDIIASFQAIEKAGIAHDADEWSKHMADELVVYGTGRAPNPKSGRIATIRRQKESNTAVTVGEVETMRLWVYGDAAAMTATHVMPDNSRPPYLAARVWVKRNGQWQMTISQQTDIK
jgi:hypothetical protein